MYDVVSLGEVMIRLSPPKHERLRRATSLDVHVAGSQLNVAADLARLGKRAAFLSKLPANELGLLARDACMGYGVDVSHIQLVPAGRMGVNYVEFGATPRAGVAVYDRAGSAASAITATDFPWRDILAGTRLAYTDGIFPGLGEGCLAASGAFLEAAREEGCVTCFDVNYREHLWTPDAARAAWHGLLGYVDVLATNRSVAETVFGYRGSDEEIAARFHDEYGCEVVCLTSREMPSVLHGAWSSLALRGGEVIHGRRYEYDVVDRYGTGDAWFAGFLYGYLSRDLRYALDFGNALCALAHTMEGDVVHASESEVGALLAPEYDLRVRR
jgi:2-dehydro-3-deoxygluconokinase